jgi:hypothetical protein
MKKEDIKINVASDFKGPLDIVIREGQAETIFYPQKIRSTGTINSPFRYSVKIDDKKKALVEYSVSNLTIKLFSDPSDEKGAEIIGCLRDNPDLIEFGINKNKMFTGAELINHARTHSHCFEKVQDVKDLIQSLQNFEVQYESTIVKTDDRKGVTEDSVKSAIKINKGAIKMDLDLFMPIHVGGPKYGIKVQVEIEKQKGGNIPVFGFYSLELENTIINASEAIMADEILKLKDFVCIQVS